MKGFYQKTNYVLLKYGFFGWEISTNYPYRSAYIRNIISIYKCELQMNYEMWCLFQAPCAE